MLRKPEWLKSEYNKDIIDGMNAMLEGLNLNTVCNEAACPNRGECYRKQTATFMILGVNCTRRCRYCNVTQSSPTPVDLNEPQNVADAVKKLGLRHVVITSVTRDDLPDGGAAHFAEVTKAVKRSCPDTVVELLIPDFGGDTDALKTVLYAKPHVLGHNLETVRRLFPKVRPQAGYDRSLALLRKAKEISFDIITKTGIMAGLSETPEEVFALMADAVSVGCDILTIGQYLRPSKAHIEVSEYVHPDVFALYAEKGVEKGIKYVYSAPFVRSSYNASDAYNELMSLRLPL